MVVVDAQYVEPYTVDLAVQRKSVDGNFTVVDINGSLMFKIKDTRFSFHDRHILYDATDKPVLTFKKKLRSIHGRWQAFKGESTTHKDLLFSVKKSSVPKHETELDVFLVENKEETQCDCKVIGDWGTKSCTIYAQDGSTILAEVHDKQNIMNVVQGKDTFGITVYPEVDYVFIVALVVILTEIKTYDGSDKRKKKKKKAKKSDSSDDDSGKNVNKKKDERKEEEEKLKVEKGQEQIYDEEEDEDDNEEEEEEEEEDDDDDDDEDDDDDDDDYDDEDDHEDENHDDNDGDDGTYKEDPKYDEYDDEDDDERSSTSED